MTPVALPLRIGARTLATIRRRLIRVALSLGDVLEGQVPTLPDAAGDGWLVTSLPAARVAQVETDGRIVMVRQRYTRFYTDLTIGHDAWLAGLSSSARATLRRKTRKAAAAGLTIRAYRTPEAFAAFHPLARMVSAKTYQETLLEAGLPEDAAAVADLMALAAADDVRAWLLLHEDTPVAYLCCTAQGSALRYDHVGHDPAWGPSSPGTVLHAAAMRDLFDDRFARFDSPRARGGTSGSSPPAGWRASICWCCGRRWRTARRCWRWRHSIVRWHRPSAAPGIRGWRRWRSGCGDSGLGVSPLAGEALGAISLRCTCAPKPLSSRSVRMASMARWCGR